MLRTRRYKAARSSSDGDSPENAAELTAPVVCCTLTTFSLHWIITNNDALQLRDTLLLWKRDGILLSTSHTAPLLPVTTTATQPKLTHNQVITLRLIFTSSLQCRRCSHLSRSERARSPHFLDCDAPDRAGLGARDPGEGERDGLGVLPTVVSDRTAMPHSADRHNKTTSRPTQDTHSAAPHHPARQV